MRPTIAQWREMKKKLPNTLILFPIGDGVEVYNKDAEVISEVTGWPIEKLKIEGRNIKLIYIADNMVKWAVKQCVQADAFKNVVTAERIS